MQHARIMESHTCNYVEHTNTQTYRHREQKEGIFALYLRHSQRFHMGTVGGVDWGKKWKRIKPIRKGHKPLLWEITPEPSCRRCRGWPWMKNLRKRTIGWDDKGVNGACLGWLQKAISGNPFPHQSMSSWEKEEFIGKDMETVLRKCVRSTLWPCIFLYGTKVLSIQCPVVVKCHAGLNIHAIRNFEICDISHHCVRLCSDLPRVCMWETSAVSACDVRWGRVWFLSPWKPGRGLDHSLPIGHFSWRLEESVLIDTFYI